MAEVDDAPRSMDQTGPDRCTDLRHLRRVQCAEIPGLPHLHERPDRLRTVRIHE
ncbi:hypothetical protein ACFFX0_27010 [Citricoccus parietis]|uniref:Uncharacterized protein n=1 Tax=Citricoccus parietis TaxID=592307 RepID=A0ABV5G6Q9_9MICC